MYQSRRRFSCPLPLLWLASLGLFATMALADDTALHWSVSFANQNVRCGVDVAAHVAARGGVE